MAAGFGRIAYLRAGARGLPSHPSGELLDGRPAHGRNGQSPGERRIWAVLDLVSKGVGAVLVCFLGAMAGRT